MADQDAGLLSKTGQELNLPGKALFTNPLKAIEEAEYDAIAVIVRNPARKAILLKALARGVPVLVEKPLVHTLADLKEVYRTVKASRAPLMVSQNYRFEPQTRRLVQFVQERNSWGALRTVSVRFVRSIREQGNHYVRRLPAGLGLGAEMCIHHYDLMRLLTGRNPAGLRAVSHHTSGGAMQGWGGIDAWLEFSGETFVCYHADYEVPVSRTGWGGDWDLDFEKGSLSWHPYHPDRIPVELHTPLRGRWNLAVKRSDASNPFEHYLVDAVHREFSRALDEGREPECGLRDNSQSLAMMWAVNEAAKTGKEIHFEGYLNKVLKGCP